jgi:phosphinothricin acetyltransferase
MTAVVSGGPIVVIQFTSRAEHPKGEPLTIRAATSDDAAAIADIYNHYVMQTVVTFEEEPVVAAEIARRIDDVQSASLLWLVAEEKERIVGYAYAAQWRARTGYRFSAEVTIYLAPEHTGRGIGSRLYGELFHLLQARGLHAVMGGITLPNDASVALHEKFGLRKVAHFKEVGFKFGHWLDVGYWQRTW